MTSCDTVPEPQSALLELGQRVIVGTRRIAVGGADGVFQQRLGRQHGEHLLGVVLPVRRAVDVAARLESAGEQRDERRLLTRRRL